MLSYQWDNQELVAKVYDLIVEHGINVWMDIHGGVTGEFLRNFVVVKSLK